MQKNLYLLRYETAEYTKRVTRTLVPVGAGASLELSVFSLIKLCGSRGREVISLSILVMPPHHFQKLSHAHTIDPTKLRKKIGFTRDSSPLHSGT
jgi:lipoate-protein ligase B